MTSGRARLAAIGAVAAFVVAALVPAVMLGSPSAQAEDVAEPSVLIVLDEMTPLVPRADSTLRIRGRVISTSKTELTGISVQLRRSSAPLTSRTEVADIAEAGLSPVDGDPDNLVLYPTRILVAETLPPGGRRGFTIKIPMADLALSVPGTYVLGLEALGVDPAVDTAEVRKGVQRTFLPWYPTPESVRPVNLVWLWPLVDWPARTASGVLLNNRTPTELAPGGRLDQLVRIGDRFRGTVSWIADASLLQTASDMTRGYQVRRDGSLVLGDGEQEAKRWLDNLASATRTVGLRTLPYADVDASAMTRADLVNDVVRAVTQAPAIASAAVGAPVDGDLYWAPFGRIDRATSNVLASAGVTALVLSSDAMPPVDPAVPTDGFATAALPTRSGTIRAVLADPALAETLALPQKSASDVIIARQRFLAETALVATTIPVDQTARTLVVAPGTVRWSPTASLIVPLLRATKTAPWLAPETLDTLLAEPGTSVSRERGGYGDRAKEAELSPQYMAMVERTSLLLDSFTSIIDDPTGISEPYSAALLRAQSSAWRANPSTGQELLTTTAAELELETAKVRVLSEGTITFSGDAGRVPVTISNDLDRSVTVGVTLRGSPPLRLESEPLTGIRIEAGRMASVDIDARVVGGDPLPVEVQLLGPDGEDYGRPADIQLVSTAYARAAAWVVAAAFGAIAVFVVFGVIRRIRTAQGGRSRPPSGPVAS